MPPKLGWNCIAAGHVPWQQCVDLQHVTFHGPTEKSCMQAELDAALKEYVGRETPLYYAERLSERYKRCVADQHE